MKTQHDGDCTIYSSLYNGNPYDGICTCGYGWSQVRKGNWLKLFSEEFVKHQTKNLNDKTHQVSDKTD